MAQVFCPPLCDAVCREHAQYPCFSSQLFTVASVFLVFLYLLSRICPNCACTLCLYSFFVFFCSRRHLSRWKHCSATAKGSRSQPVSLIDDYYFCSPHSHPHHSFNSFSHSPKWDHPTEHFCSFLFPGKGQPFPIYPEGFIFRVKLNASFWEAQSHHRPLSLTFWTMHSGTSFSQHWENIYTVLRFVSSHCLLSHRIAFESLHWLVPPSSAMFSYFPCNVT